ncbi:ribulose-phosphate 3-epimerase [Mycoplasma struthionis]|uniref:Ribulose-phosphate 3-epimerase n=1 Tax=Mycoplasma struthionis TaxID=538220 RepID=A0A502M2A6_9MOLU|nr:ribulose-phosphate 3-epimerase [Mycoplasma struthionis]TPI02386.1 ribulose-phosphate 3-epimerase [Mycoplasma struthionis]
MRKISPSILDVPRENVVEYVNTLMDYGIENVHYDVMDGKFVPNVALQYEHLKVIRENCPQHIMDGHFMVEDVFGYYDQFKDVCDILTFHYEALKEGDLEKLIRLVKKDNKKLGISLKPKTPVDVIKPYIDDLSLVLVMSVEPGFGGQKFMPEALEKIAKIKEIVKDKDIIIQVDGGVNNLTIKDAFNAGATLAVVGSYLVKNLSLETVKDLLK